MPGREIDAALSLLDRQIIDKDGYMAGNVDDLELTVPDSGGPPYVSAILAGPGALGNRVGGRLGKWLESVQERLHDENHPGPARISFGVVKRISDHVELAVEREGLEVNLLEEWTRDHVIAKIPGADRAAE